MREIKFRAWDGEKMWNPETLTADGSFTEFRFYHSPQCIKWGLYDWQLRNRLVSGAYKENILMQFTGLKDKKGKEIYEGDVVKSSIQPPHEWSGLHEVVFENGAFMIKGGNPHGRRYGEAFNYFPRNVEVVGNIYENPELLKP